MVFLSYTSYTLCINMCCNFMLQCWVKLICTDKGMSLIFPTPVAHHQHLHFFFFLFDLKLWITYLNEIIWKLNERCYKRGFERITFVFSMKCIEFWWSKFLSVMHFLLFGEIQCKLLIFGEPIGYWFMISCTCTCVLVWSYIQKISLRKVRC